MKCKLKITTSQEEYIPPQLGEELYNSTHDTKNAPAERDYIEIYADGELIEDGNRVLIRYEEGESSGLGGSVAELSFDKDSLKDVNMARTGAISVIMCFKEGSRHTCVYNTEIMPIEMVIYTKRVDNRILDLGYIEITYLIEIGGSCAQKTVMKMEIKR